MLFWIGVGICVFCFMMYVFKGDRSPLVARILGSIIFGVLVAVFSQLFIGDLLIGSFASSHYVKVSEVPLYAMKDGNSVTGNFFLGSGGFEGRMRYYYLAEDKSIGGQKLGTMRTEFVVVSENNSVSPKLETYIPRLDNGFLEYLTIHPSSEEKYKFIIPEGSIKYNYQIDLE